MGRGGRKPPFFVMGIFSSKYKTYVASTSIPLFDLDPEPLKESVLSSIIRGERVGQNLIQDAINGGSGKLDRYYQYGRDNYARGLPSGTFEQTILQSDDIVAYIESLETDSVTVTSVDFELDEPEFFLKDHLVTEYGHNRFKGTVTDIPAATLAQMDIDESNYLATVQATLEGYLPAQRVGIPVSRTVETPVNYQDRVATKVEVFTVTSEEKALLIPITKRQNFIDNTEINAGTPTVISYDINFSSRLGIKVTGKAVISYKEDVTTHYVFDDDASETTPISLPGLSKNTTPVLETFINSFTYPYTEVYTKTVNRKMPYYYIEYFTTFSELDKPDVLTPKHLFYSESEASVIGAAFPKGTREDINPYYPVVVLRRDNVDLFTPADAETITYTTSQKLLDIYGLNATDLADSINQNEGIDSIDHAYLVSGINLNTDKQSGLRYLIEYFDYISDVTNEPPLPSVVTTGNRSLNIYRDVALRVGVSYGVNSVKILEGGLDSSMYWSSITKELIQGKIGTTGFVKSKIDIVGNVELITFSHQIDQNTYRQIKIYGLKHINSIYQQHTVVTTLKDLVENDDENSFIIPLNSLVVNSLDVFTKSALFYAAPHLVFYSYDRVKLKWYQTSLFKVFMIVLAIVVFVFTGIEIYSIYAAAIATGATVGVALWAVSVYIINLVLTNVVLSYAFKYVIKVLGTEFAFLAAIMAFASAAYGNFAGVESLAATWASELMMLSTGISKAITESMAEDLEDLLKEASIFEAEAKDLMDELEQKQELLAPSKLLDPFEFIRTEPLNDFNETPTNFYNRTIHNVNVASLSYSAIEDFVDLNLALPKVNHNF